MSIKVILEFRAKAGQRAELLDALEALVSKEGGSTRGYLGSTRHEVVDDPDLVVEIAEWETVEARAQHLEDAKSSGAFAAVFALLDGPPRVIILRDLAPAAE